MNQNNYFIVKAGLALLLTLGLGGCETSTPESLFSQGLSHSGMGAVSSEHPDSNSSSPNGSIYCSTTFQKVCDVEVFDGFSLIKLPLSTKGIYYSKGNPTQKLRHVVFLRAQGAEPQIKILPSNGNIQLTLHPMRDPRSSYLIGCVGRVISGPESLGLLQHDKPIRVVLQRGRSRQIIYTDTWGVFKTELPSGRYIMHVGNQHKVIDVPVQDSAIVTITLQRMLQN